MFMQRLRRIINTGQARSIILTGNVYDLFFDGEKYVPLVNFLSSKVKADSKPEIKGITQLIFRQNNNVEVRGDFDELRGVWSRFGGSGGLSDALEGTNSNATFALEVMRQLTECMRRHSRRDNNLVIIIEAADLLLPESEISRMSNTDRRRLAIMYDWLSDPDFLDGGDTVILLSESRSSIHSRVSKLPQVVSVDIPLPNLESRLHFVNRMMCDGLGTIGNNDIASMSAGLSIQALRQFLLGGEWTADELTAKVEEYMVGQMGDGVIEFKRPSHTGKDIIGASRIKDFVWRELIPGFRDGSIGGAAVGGPIGGGKTFICEAIAAELSIPVIVLKSIRSKWFGETDKIFERLRRLLEKFHQIVIFVDEADTQFGSIQGGHETEKRLTGKIQAMMSDVQLRGKVIWFLMTARIHLLSPDIRRPGRMDLIIPILDPEGKDRTEFIRWCFGGIEYAERPIECLDAVQEVTAGYSAAAFAMLRSNIKKCGTLAEAITIANDMVLPDIVETRRYQTLQAKINCTRKSLLFEPGTKSYDNFEEMRQSWRFAIAELEAKGVR